jgi:hypothetical protein
MNKSNDNFDQLSFDPSPVDWTKSHQKGRITALRQTFDRIGAANRSEGIRHMTDDNPKSKEIDELYSRDVDGLSFMAGRDAIIERADNALETAAANLGRACLRFCKMRGCPYRDNFELFEDKYHYAPARKALLKKLEKDPKSPC